jgi:UDP-N-acetyl-D-mannosaminuronate dehydrogenase
MLFILDNTTTICFMSGDSQNGGRIVKVSVIGTGYLGAVHAASLASVGFTVVGIDTDSEKVALLN